MIQIAIHYLNYTKAQTVTTELVNFSQTKITQVVSSFSLIYGGGFPLS